MVHTEIFNRTHNTYYGVKMNDNVNVIIHVNRWGEISCCGASSVKGRIVSDTNADSNPKIISEDLATQMIKTFGAYILERYKYDIHTKISYFEIKK